MERSFEENFSLGTGNRCFANLYGSADDLAVNFRSIRCFSCGDEDARCKKESATQQAGQT
jgi:ferredoxin-like protein FixX